MPSFEVLDSLNCPKVNGNKQDHHFDQHGLFPANRALPHWFKSAFSETTLLRASRLVFVVEHSVLLRDISLSEPQTIFKVQESTFENTIWLSPAHNAPHCWVVHSELPDTHWKNYRSASSKHMQHFEATFRESLRGPCFWYANSQLLHLDFNRASRTFLLFWKLKCMTYCIHISLVNPKSKGNCCYYLQYKKEK